MRIYRRRRELQAAEGRFSPAADAALKRVFAAIGVPEQAPFSPDPFQLEALEAVENADCLVTAPTGAGKTWIAEQAIHRVLARGGRAWYACPLKALSNAKFADFGRIFGPEQVGILTGDRKENADAAVIVGTTEILRNQLYDAMHRGESLGFDFVVLDEAHFLGDRERGVVWEEVMIYLPSRIPLLLLSATIGNAREIAAWLSSVRGRPCRVVEESRRPVPLFPLFLHPTGLILPFNRISRRGTATGGLHEKVLRFVRSKRSPFGNRPPSFGRIIEALRRFDLLPAIFFLKSRAECDQALSACLGNQPANGDRLSRTDAIVREFKALSERIGRHRQLYHLTELAVASHHAGQLPIWKLLVERLMTEGLLDAVFATSTVAAGVNFPARTIVLLYSDRFNGSEFLPLDPTEFHQMTGRAGRRGMDRIGFVLTVPNRFMDILHVAALLNAEPSDVQSRIHINFSMVLNLLLSHSPAQIEDLLRRSFAAFRRGKAMRRGSGRLEAAERLWREFEQHLAFLREHGYVDRESALTADGLWASRLRVDQPLLIAEGFRRAAFPQNDPALLAGLIATFVFEKEIEGRLSEKLIPRPLASAYRRLALALSPFVEEMLNSGFEARPFSIRPAAALYAWAKGATWERTLEICELEEGDLAVLILRTADNLRHVAALAEVFPEPAAAAVEAVAAILRDPVVDAL